MNNIVEQGVSDGTRDKSKLDTLLDIFDIDENVCVTLRDIKPYVMPIFDKAVSKLYERIDDIPHLRSFFNSDERKEQASRAQKEHWSLILDGRFDEEYVKRAEKIGHVHSKVGLDPQWYMSSYSLIFDNIISDLTATEFQRWRNRMNVRKISAEDVGELISSIEKKQTAIHRVYMLDMEISLTAYFEANVRKDKEAFRAIAKSFDYIASGDLTQQLEEGVIKRSPFLHKSFERLREGLSELVTNVKGMAVKIGEASQHVKEQVRSIEDENKRQNEAIEKTHTSMNALDQSMSSIAEQVHELDDQMKTCLGFVASGNSNMSSIQQNMDDIQSAWNSVTDLTSTIRNIASQTNFLALNASVEAARAGDAGKGFAVVASAIRELSQKTTKTVESIARSSSENEELISNGVRNIGKTLEAFHQAGEEIKAVSGVSNKISSELLEKKDDISSMTQQCSLLSQIVEKTNKSVKDGRRNAITLNKMVQQLNDQTQKFRS